MSKACYHCGDPIPVGTHYQTLIIDEQRDMCCPGCQAVAQTIIDSGLVSYYQYRTEPADKADLIPDQLEKLIHYDDPNVQDEFVHQTDSGKSISLSLDGVSCAACAWLIEKQLRQNPGVIKILVNITTSRAQLIWDDTQTSLSELLTQIHKLGYKAAPFEANIQEANYHAQLKQLLYRLGVAGLATMQVMMLAVALYFEVFSDLDDEFKHYFRLVSLIFATPVLLYSAQPFYINAWRSLKARTLGMDVPVTLALIFAYCASIYATFTGKGDVYFESISMFTFFLLLGRFLEMRARRKAAAASANLLKRVPNMATKVDGSQVPVRSLVIDDQIKVLPGEYIPADGFIVEGESLIDESMLTGESIPIHKSINDPIFAGTLNGQESLILKVSALKGDTVIANIVRLQDEAQASKPQIAQLADTIAKYFIALLLCIAAGTWIYWHQHQPEQAFWIMLSVLVATCPCALSLATPTAITCATSSLGKLGILLRKGHGIETLCQVNQLIVDKTGTLTQGSITLNKIHRFQDNYSEQSYYAIAASLESNANHPIAEAFRDYQTQDVTMSQVENKIGHGLSGLFKNQVWKIGKLDYCVDNPPTLEDQNLSCIYLSCNNKLMARFEYQDPIRPEAAEFIQNLHQADIDVCILTGDQEKPTQVIAQKLGIQTIHTNATPEQKLSILKTYNQQKVTLMVGDGINDAPTLAGAHLSIAMGGGTDVAKASADMVLLGDKLNRILLARQLALKTRRIIRQNLAWALGYNLIILPLAVMGYIAPYFAVIGMSLSSILVVSNSLRLLKNPDDIHQK